MKLLGMIFVLTVIDFHSKKQSRRDFCADKIFIKENVCFYYISVKEKISLSKWHRLHSCFDYENISAVTPKTDDYLPK